MPLPVIADMFQSTYVWGSASAPRPATTTLHWHDAAGGQSEAALYADLNTNTVANLYNTSMASAVVNTVVITKLDGASAAVSFPTGSPSKWGGNGGTEGIPQGACVISIKSARRGSRGRNRIYLPWVSEASQAGGTMDVAAVATQQTAWNTFVAAMFAQNWTLAAVSAVHSDWNSASTYTVKPYLKTQRRRARR